MKTPEENIRKKRASSAANNEATNVANDAALDQEAIALLAYFYWEARDGQNGSPEEDWLRAEAELRNRLAAAAAA
jgi:hypothetical protein